MDAGTSTASPRPQAHITEEALEAGGGDDEVPQEDEAIDNQEELYLAENTLLDCYRILKILGHGNFSTTYLAEVVPTEPEPPDPPKTVAIKRLKHPYSPIGENEFSLLEFLHSQQGEKPRHIISPISCFFTSTDHFHLVLEPLDSARPVSLPQCVCGVHSKLACPLRHLALAKILMQLLSGLLSLHSHNLIHADLTPANILFLPGSNRIKLIDFGNVIRLEDRGAYLDDFDVQSARYRAPEILLGVGPISRLMDVWSVGVIAVEMVLDGEVVGEGGRGELMRCGEGREALVRRVVELMGSVEVYRGGLYWMDVYDDISLEPVVFTPRKRKRKGSYEEAGARVGRGGILREFLEEGMGDMGAVGFLMDMMEVGVGRRKAVKGVLRHPWLVKQLLGDWGNVLMGGADDMDGQSDVDGVEDQLEVDVPGEEAGEDGDDDHGLPNLDGQFDEELELEQIFGVGNYEDIREQSTDRLDPDYLPPPAERSPSPYRSVWEDITDSPPPESQLQLDEVGRGHSSSPEFSIKEEDADEGLNFLSNLECEDTDHSAPETSLITNDDTTNMTLGEDLLSSPPSSPPLPGPPLLEDHSTKTSESCSPSPIAFVGRATELVSGKDGGEEDTAVEGKASDVWHRDLAADMVSIFLLFGLGGGMSG